jgi:heterodisulfide reductase subunit C
MGLKDKLLRSEMIWQCSKCRECVFVCPQDVRFADIMGAIREIALDQGFVTHQDLLDMGKVAWVARDHCVSCLTCVRVCPWQVPVIDKEGVAAIDPRTCRGCGICVAECPVQTIKMNESTDERLIVACGTGN